MDEWKKKLAGNLPGEKAHRWMMPAGRSPRQPEADRRAVDAAVACILFPEGDNWHFPLIIRTQDEGLHSGQIALPGGRKDNSDQDLEHTARRESREEIGVDLEEAELLGKLSPLYIPVSGFLVTPFVYRIQKVPEFRRQESEVAAVITVSLSQLSEFMEHRKDVEVETARGRLTVPGIELPRGILWGATAMILAELNFLIGKD